MIYVQLTTKTAIEDEGIFYLRPLFYDSIHMEYRLSSSNFKPRYESFKNPFHPFLTDKTKKDKSVFNESHKDFDMYNRLNTLRSIFEDAMIINRTNNIIKENRKIIPGFYCKGIINNINLKFSCKHRTSLRRFR